MILSVSRRTDIPAFYWKWFLNRIGEGFVDVRNPMNIHQVSRINIRPEVVDCIVFWTKNAENIIPHLPQLNNYKYYFQYTINPYNKLIEEKVPVKKDIIRSFKLLSDLIGPNRVVWRYDPIIITPDMDVDYHLHYFEELAKRLYKYTNKCVISFVDLYKKTVSNTKSLMMREPSEEEMHTLAKSLSSIAKHYQMEIQSCSEKENLDAEGIKHGCCIDRDLIEKTIGYKIEIKKDKNQRKECGCVESIDIGAYNTCLHACRYCYANFNSAKVEVLSRLHNPDSTMLIGELNEKDIVKERKVKLLKTDALIY